MSRIAYVDGAYRAHSEAFVHIEDRGFQFADAVYEVWSVFDGRLADLTAHLARLERSLGQLRIDMPMPKASLIVVLNEVIRKNHIREGLVYLQISRGVAPRDHFFPIVPVKPTLVITAKMVDRNLANSKALKGISVMSAPDNRWGRCDIKTVGLLPNVLGKQAARDKGCQDVIFVDAEGFVTEAGAANVYMVSHEGEIKTRSLRANILPGVTRISLLEILRETGHDVSEGAFSLEEAKAAKEVFISAATSFVMPIIAIDGKPIGEGVSGPIALDLRNQYIHKARLTAGT
jgi:D-alanine transaminase